MRNRAPGAGPPPPEPVERNPNPVRDDTPFERYTSRLGHIMRIVTPYGPMEIPYGSNVVHKTPEGVSVRQLCSTSKMPDES
jgi:hypothetical protein